MVPRISLALDDGLLALPDGVVGVWNAPAEFDAAPCFIAEQRFFPDYTRLKARGIDVAPVLDTAAPMALIHCHRAKAATYDMIARACAVTPPGGIVAVNGAKTDGIESVLKDLKRRFSGVESYSKAHGKLVWFANADADLSDWIAQPRQHGGFWTTAGVFAADKIDQGSALLAAHLPALKGRGVDLGAGGGYLAAHVLKGDAVALDMIEADYHAADMARRNVTDPRATIIWGDVLAHTGRYDFAISNPPFHIDRKPDATLGQQFIARAAQLLTPKGQFWMVANRQLPYEAALDDNFHRVETKAQTGGFKVIHATRPKTARR